MWRREYILCIVHQSAYKMHVILGDFTLSLNSKKRGKQRLWKISWNISHSWVWDNVQQFTSYVCLVTKKYSLSQLDILGVSFKLENILYRRIEFLRISPEEKFRQRQVNRKIWMFKTLREREKRELNWILSNSWIDSFSLSDQ